MGPSLHTLRCNPMKDPTSIPLDREFVIELASWPMANPEQCWNRAVYAKPSSRTQGQSWYDFIGPITPFVLGPPGYQNPA